MPKKEKTKSKLMLSDDATVNATKEFYLVVNDPKRNRNRVRSVEGVDKYFSPDGSNSVYVVVSYIKNNKEIEAICRASRPTTFKEQYTCKRLKYAISYYGTEI